VTGRLNKQPIDGFTLLEVLIALVIVAIGLLSNVNLQAMAKQFNHQAMQRTLAVNIADSIAERIRANPSALLTYSSSHAIGGNTITIEPSPDCRGISICNSQQVARHDLWKIEQTMDSAATKGSGLINAMACFNFTANTGKTRTGTLHIRVQWTGLNKLSDAVKANGNNCNSIAAGNDLYRRQLLIDTYLYDATES